MALSPLVLVQDGAGPWVATTNGVDVTPGNTISIKLVDTSDAVDWYLQILGTDELITAPSLTGVNPLDNKVTTTTTVVTFTMPAGTGHALRFQSQVTGVGGPLTTTFGIYSLTPLGRRVGASTEEREGNSTYGWITITNPLIRAGAGFSAGGDLTGSASSQTVSYVRGVTSPDPILATHGKLAGVVEDYPPELFSPRAVATDGIDLYVAQSTMLYATTLDGSGFVHKLRPVGDGSVLEVVGKVDLTTVLPTIDRVRDLALDSTYIYAACWTSENVAIIDKATMTIVGWGWLGAGQQATSVCADGVGNFYCYGQSRTSNGIAKFSTAACLGQPPNTVGPSLTYTPTSGRGRWVRFGGGYIWHTDAGNGIGTQKIDPATMTLVIDDANATAAMSSLYAFGSVWVTDAALKRLDPTTLALQSNITLPNCNTPSEITLGPDSLGTPNARIYVSDENTKYVYVINPTTNTLEATFTPGANKFSGVATIGNVVYAMAYVYGMYEAPNGIFFVNYPTGIVGAVTYKPKLEYQSQGKFDRGYVGNVLLGMGMYAGKIGQVPRVVDAITEPLDMAYDGRLDPAVEEGPYVWIPRKKSRDIICWDLYTDAFGYTIPLQLAGESFDPHTVLVSPKYVWVLGWYGHIVKIDRATRDVLDYRLKFPTANTNEGLAWDDTNGCVLTTGGSETGIVYSLDATTHRITRYDLSATINEPGTGIIAVGTKAFYFGQITFWQIDLTTWVVGPPISIPNPSTARVRAKYEGGYIWFISQLGSDLARVDPVTAALSSITVGSGTMGMAYSADDDAVLVTLDGTGIQYVTSATGVMALGAARGLTSPATMGGVIYDPSYQRFYFTTERKVSPYEALINSVYYGGVGNINVDSGDNFINGRMEWYTPSAGGTLAGDVTGAIGSNTVARLQGRNVSSTAPTTGDTIYWDGSQWAPAGLASDVTGSIISNTVARIRGRTVATTAPTNGQVLTWVAGSSWWAPATPAGGGAWTYKSDGTTLGSSTTILDVTGRQSRRSYSTGTATLNTDEPTVGLHGRYYEHIRSNDQHVMGAYLVLYQNFSASYREMLYWDGPEGPGSGQRYNAPYYSITVPTILLLDYNSGTSTVVLLEAFSGVPFRSFGSNGATTGWYRMMLVHDPNSAYVDHSRVWIGKDNVVEAYGYTSGSFSWSISTNVGTALSRFYLPQNGWPFSMWWVDSGGLKQISNTMQGSLPSVTVMNAAIPAAHDFASDGYNVYISCPAANAVYKVDPNTGTAISGWPKTVTGAKGLAFDGRYLWVTNASGAVVLTAIDPVTGNTVATYSPSGPSGALELTFDGTYLWLISGGTKPLTKIDPRLATGGVTWATVSDYATGFTNGDNSRLVPVRAAGGRGGWTFYNYTATTIYFWNNPEDAIIANLNIQGGGFIQAPWHRSQTGAPHQLMARNGLVTVEADIAPAVTTYTLLLPKSPPYGTRILITDASAGIYLGPLTVTVQADATNRLLGTLGGTATVTNGQTKEFIWVTCGGGPQNWIVK